jgi:hypothetical protein
MIMRLARLALAVVSTSTLAVFAIACSDPVPPTPQGAWNVTLVSSGPACHIMGHNAHMGSVTSSTKDSVLVSGGTEGAEITCVVSGTGTFSVSGTGNLNGLGAQISIPAIDASATAMKPAHGSISFASGTTGGTYSSPSATPCDFYFVHGSGEGVASGRIWVAFTCATVVQEMSTCNISESFAIFENCGE